jgi:hypothetical protein
MASQRYGRDRKMERPSKQGPTCPLQQPSYRDNQRALEKHCRAEASIKIMCKPAAEK